MGGLRRMLANARAARVAQNTDRAGATPTSVLPDGQASGAFYNARIKSLMPQGTTFNNGVRDDNGFRADHAIYRAPNFMKG